LMSYHFRSTKVYNGGLSIVLFLQLSNLKLLGREMYIPDMFVDISVELFNNNIISCGFVHFKLPKGDIHVAS
jgi:hypothetical protein